MAYVEQGPPTRRGTPYDVCWADADGRKRSKRFYDETKATKEAGRIEDQLRRGVNTDPRAGRTTFQAVAADYLATRTKATPRTVTAYRRLLELHAFPAFGSRPIARLTAADIGRFVTSLYTTQRGKPRRPAGFERIMAPVKAVLTYAVDEGYMPRNPARNIDPPTAKTLGVDPFEGTALTPAQVAALASDCGRQHQHGELLVWFVALTGLRAAEVGRLDLGDVNALHKWLSVRRTKNGRDRRVDYSAALHARLDPYLRTHPRAGEPAAPLFYGRDNHARPDPARRLDAGTFYRRVFKPAARRLGLPHLRFHDLRHTAGSWWIEAGLSLETVSARLGHADINFTRRTYIHQLHTRAEEDATRVDTWITNQLATPANVRRLRAVG